MALAEEIQTVLSAGTLNPDRVAQFRTRLTAGKLTRSEDPASHFCVYFLPFDAAKQKVFLVAHKKSGLWLSPGGHIEPNDTLLQTLNREIREELGVPDALWTRPNPFLLTMVDIPENQKRACRRHYDAWFLLPTDGRNFVVDPSEFHETRWVNKAQALELLTDSSNIEAITAVLT